MTCKIVAATSMLNLLRCLFILKYRTNFLHVFAITKPCFPLYSRLPTSSFGFEVHSTSPPPHSSRTFPKNAKEMWCLPDGVLFVLFLFIFLSFLGTFYGKGQVLILLFFQLSPARLSYTLELAILATVAWPLSDTWPWWPGTASLPGVLWLGYPALCWFGKRGAISWYLIS